MTVEVRYLGHLGNNLFQYALGRIVAEALALPLFCHTPAAAHGWSRVEGMAGIVDHLAGHSAAFADAPQSLPGRAGDGGQLRYVIGEKHNWSGHGINLPWLLRHGHRHHIVLHGYFQRAEYYLPYRTSIARWFALDVADNGPRLGPRDVLVHLRQSVDMLLLDRAIDMAFYVDALAAMAPARVYVCGLGLGPAVRRALAPFAPIYLDLSAIATLKLMLRAERIVLANSTFSWWGAWLSDASEIVYPRVVRNFWGADRADVALEVPAARYRYVDDVAIQDWRPFQPLADVEWRLEGQTDAHPRLHARSKHTSMAIELNPALAALAAWLVTRTTAFGLIDIEVCELTPAAREDAPRLLLALARHGFLDIDADVVQALAAIYGEVAARP